MRVRIPPGVPIYVNFLAISSVICIVHHKTENSMSSLLLQVKELLSRNLDAVEIASRLHMNINTVQDAIEALSKMS